MQHNHEELEHYMESRLPEFLGMLEQMVAINSFTANPEGVNRLGKLTAGLFTRLGFQSRLVRSQQENLGYHLLLERSGQAGPSDPVIAMVSHLDTVFPAEEEVRNNFQWRPEGDRIYGPGTIDIKGGTAMIYLVFSAIQALHRDLFEATRWIVLLNAAEEILDPAFGQVARSVIPDDALACLVFEGGQFKSNRFSMVAARKGMVDYRVEVEGKAAHAGSKHRRGANAITELARAVNAIAGMTDYDREVTFNIGAIQGGTVSNRVPHFAEAHGELRAFSTDALDVGVGRLLALQESSSVRSDDGDFACRLRVDILGRWEPWPANAASDGLLAFWQQAAHEMGMEAVREERGGLSDGNFIWDHVPTLDGLGLSGGNSHCSERSADGKKEQEYLELPAVLPKAMLNTLAIVRLLKSRQ